MFSLRAWMMAFVVTQKIENAKQKQKTKNEKVNKRKQTHWKKLKSNSKQQQKKRNETKTAAIQNFVFFFFFLCNFWDCCDGSDEWGNEMKCANTCISDANDYKSKLLKLHQRVKQVLWDVYWFICWLFFLFVCFVFCFVFLRFVVLFFFFLEAPYFFFCLALPKIKKNKQASEKTTNKQATISKKQKTTKTIHRDLKKKSDLKMRE